jgi:hypothetical protein
MKITYPEKYNELINQYGEIDGLIKYKKFLRSFSLEKCILKYGEEEGNKKFVLKSENIKNSGVSLKKMIDKYGEEEGLIRYNNWKSQCLISLDNFIKKYGEIEGNKKWMEFKLKSNISYKSKNDTESKYNNRNHITRLEYWTEKCNGNLKLAKEKLSERQSTSTLNKFIKKYGDIEGKKKYQLANINKAITLENCIKKYGEIEGLRKYNKYKELINYSHSKQYYINKYGEEWYDDYSKRKITYFKDRFSKIGLEFALLLNNEIKYKYKNIYFGENEYMFFVHKNEFTIISPDFFIKDINLVIEFYGDYWHCNPNCINNIDRAKKIWDYDENRINTLKQKFNVDVLIIWEQDYIKNKQIVIEYILNYIKKNYD